jgi:hypothetical protein
VLGDQIATSLPLVNENSGITKQYLQSNFVNFEHKALTIISDILLLILIVMICLWFVTDQAHLGDFPFRTIVALVLRLKAYKGMPIFWDGVQDVVDRLFVFDKTGCH